MEAKVLELLEQIKDVSKHILNKDIASIRGFSQRQLKAISQQTILVQKGVSSGAIDEDLMEYFFDGIEAMTRNFVNTLKGLLVVTVEKLWNAISDLLWDTITSAINLAL